MVGTTEIMPFKGSFLLNLGHLSLRQSVVLIKLTKSFPGIRLFRVWPYVALALPTCSHKIPETHLLICVCLGIFLLPLILHFKMAWLFFFQNFQQFSLTQSPRTSFRLVGDRAMSGAHGQLTRGLWLELYIKLPKGSSSVYLTEVERC